MKKLIILSYFSLILLGTGCQKDQSLKLIDSEITEIELSEQLNDIFTDANTCLKFKEDTVVRAIFTLADFKKLDSCNSLPAIDFSKYTMVAGRILVSSISDSLSSVTLRSDNDNLTYDLKVSITKCDECWPALDHKYFWRIYPKLDDDYRINLSWK